MVIIKVVAMFDDRTVLKHAKDELVRAGLATEEAMQTEPEEVGESTDSAPPKTAWERLVKFFESEAEHDVSTYAEGLRRGSALLVVETPNEAAEQVKNVLRRNGAIDLRRRVHRWITTGWETFDPAAPTFTEVEILDERRANLHEWEIEGGSDRTISVFEKAEGRLLGKISEAELAVLQGAMEEDRPGDDDYWINADEVERIAARPGATGHLDVVLHRAVAGHPDGVDVRFEREG